MIKYGILALIASAAIAVPAGVYAERGTRIGLIVIAGVVVAFGLITLLEHRLRRDHP